MLIVGISGKIGAGKDYLAKKYVQKNPNKNVLILSFADFLKSEISERFCIPLEDLYDREKKIFHRKLLQEYGQQVKIERGENYWARKLFHTIDVLSLKNDFDIVFIPDTRFFVESEFIRFKSGIIIRIEAPMRCAFLSESNANNHSSETELDYYSFDRIINNDVDGFDEFNDYINSLV